MRKYLLKKFPLFQRAVSKMCPRYAYLDTDVVIMSYPKSGRNWISFLLANVMCIEDEKDIDIHFKNYQKWVSTDIPRSPPVESFRPPRIVSTHEKYKGQSGKVIYLLRHPADVMESHYVYLKEYEGIKGLGEFSEFIRSDRWFGVESWNTHLNSIKKKDDKVIVKFEDLKNDAGRELKKILSYIGIKTDDESVKKSVKRSKFGRMKKMEEKYGKRGDSSGKANFMRKGRVDRGKEFFAYRDYEYLREVCKNNMKKYGYKVPTSKYNQ